MHGIVFNELQRYVSAKHSPAVWRQILKDAQTENTLYMPTQSYPDEEMMGIIHSAESLSQTPKKVILEDFGQFIAPNLVGIFVKGLNKDWDAMDLLEHTETTIHKVVRQKNPKASPPKLQISRPKPHRVEIRYYSERKLCYFALGLVKGILQHYEEQADIRMPECMTEGDERTLIVVQKS